MTRTELVLGSLPGRKSKALILITYQGPHAAKVKPLAYFRSDDAYVAFKKALAGRALYLAEAEIGD